MKRTINPKSTKKLKGTRGCTVKHFAFCYNNKCPVYKKAKYSTSYWPQKLSPKSFKGIKKENKLDRLHYGKDMHRNNEPKNPMKKTANLYLNPDYSNLYNFYLKKETFSNSKDTKIKNYAA